VIRVTGTVTGRLADGSVIVSLTATSRPADQVLVTLRAVIAPAAVRPAPG
jgi:hypothetical protein